jgi:aquaporin rerated protein, other eukaryote
VQGFFIEMMLTFQLVLTIYLLAVEKHRATFLAPLGIGLSLFTAELAGVYYTGGSLNPARSFGPCVANREFPLQHWIYWAGPVCGAILAAGFYKLLKVLRYESCNPGQDGEEVMEMELRSLLRHDAVKAASRPGLQLSNSFARPLSFNNSWYERRSVDERDMA